MKYVVAPKRSLIQGRKQWAAGKDVTPQKLGLTQKAFDAMVAEGSIVAVETPKKKAGNNGPRKTSGGRSRDQGPEQHSGRSAEQSAASDESEESES